MSIFDIRVQKLFAITLGLKVFSSFLAWKLQSPWSLGLAVPLALMAGYILIGLHRRDTDVSDEKFADSAYYLGFIFTITSIIFSLLDLPNIGTHIQDIAVRFGAAMVSTVFGLFVRVYLVSFRADAGDALHNAEEALLGATQTFTERLTMAVERLQDFESRVDLATKSSVERINLQIESLSKNHADKLTVFFEDLASRNQQAFTAALEEVKSASVRLASSFDGYSMGMKSNLESIEEKVTLFATAVATRLQNTTFPDDYFSRQLQAPLALLESAASEIAEQVNAASTEISKTNKAVGTSLRKVQAKSEEAEQSMESVMRLAGQQQLILEAAQGQLGAIEKVADNLMAFDKLLNTTMEQLAANTSTTEALTTQVAKLATESVEGRQSIASSLASVTVELAGYQEAASQMVRQMATNMSSSERIAERIEVAAESQVAVANNLRESAALSAQVAAKYDQASADVRQSSSDLLASIDERAEKTMSKVGETVQALRDVVRHIDESAALSAQVIAKYDQASADARQASSNLLATIDERTEKTVSKVGETVQALQDVVRHIGDLNKSLRSNADTAGPMAASIGIPSHAVGNAPFGLKNSEVLLSASIASSNAEGVAVGDTVVRAGQGPLKAQG